MPRLPLHPPYNWEWYVWSVRMYSAMIASGINFAEATYGDGEWACILGKPGGTSKGQIYEKWLGEALKNTILNPAGQWCVYLGALGKPLRAEVDRWRQKHDPDVVWLAMRSVSAANCHGELGVVFKALRQRDVILVGPEHFRKLPKGIVGHKHHIQVTGSRAYDELDATCEAVLRLSNPGDVVLFSSGMASNVAIHRLCKDLLGKVTLWDVGAIFDPYCGVWSRKVYKTEKWQKEIMPLNLK